MSFTVTNNKIYIFVYETLKTTVIGNVKNGVWKYVSHDHHHVFSHESVKTAVHSISSFYTPTPQIIICETDDLMGYGEGQNVFISGNPYKNVGGCFMKCKKRDGIMFDLTLMDDLYMDGQGPTLGVFGNGMWEVLLDKFGDDTITQFAIGQYGEQFFYCDECGDTIEGIRYNCNECIDFDLCQTCKEECSHEETHQFTIVDE